MDFPVIGDAVSYPALGTVCATAFHHTGNFFEHCYNGIRPIGSLIYFAIPKLISDDTVTQTYILFAMHLCMFAVAIVSLKSILQTSLKQSFFNSNKFLLILFICSIILLLPIIPVALADLPALAFYLAGLAFLLKTPKLTIPGAFISGVFFALAALMRQNYNGFFVFAVLYLMLFRPVTFNLKSLFFLGLGFSPALFQVYWVWSHSGDLWVFDRNSLTLPTIPMVELVAFNLPSPGAYMTSIDNPNLDKLSYFVIKLYYGIVRYNHAVYLGASQLDPLSLTPYTIPVTKMLLIKSYTTLAVLLGGMLLGLLTNKKYRFLIFLSITGLLFTGWVMHVEYRYFLTFKFILMGIIISLLCSFALHLSHKISKKLFSKAL